MTPEDYVVNQGNFCPHCDSNDLEGGKFDVDTNRAWQAITCLSCEATWNDVYHLVGYDDLERPT